MKLQAGDIVRYELSWWGMPRWAGNRDHGGSGHWGEGVVVRVDDTSATVEGRTGCSSWPLAGHRDYDVYQWSWSGYVRLVRKPSTARQRSCVCGAHAVFGAGCGTHSHWCDLATAS